jgi:hypothetical protein
MIVPKILTVHAIELGMGFYVPNVFFMPLKWDGPLPQSLGKEGELWIFLTEAH